MTLLALNNSISYSKCLKELRLGRLDQAIKAEFLLAERTTVHLTVSVNLALVTFLLNVVVRLGYLEFSV